jgi:predicted acyl esterase
LTAGRLNTDFPGVVESMSLKDGHGRIVQPFGDYGTASPAKASTFRPYQVEFWPVGNVFEKGHRIRVTIVGASAASRPSLPAVNQIRIGGADGAELLVPALPGSDLTAALPK